MKLLLKNANQPITLTQKEFKGAGGEGDVYVKSQYAYKVYHDPSKMIPLGKIQELGKLTRPNIIMPQDVLLNDKGKPVGYSMRAVPDSYTLCQLFPKVFRDRNQLTNDLVGRLVQILRESMQHCHDRNILIVDMNEMNALVSKAFDDLYLIDVDSYKTPSFPATALMESVRDRHNKGVFTEGTDWFAFAITAFQMFTGIHPYKGKHATLKTLDERMLANISVLNKEVSCPPTVLPFTVIPQAYLDWFEAVFERGERTAPPATLQAAVMVAAKITRIVGSQKFDIEEMREFAENIVSVLEGGSIVVTSGRAYQAGKSVPITGAAHIAITPTTRAAIVATQERGRLKLVKITTSQEVACNIAADDMMAYEGNLYVRSGGFLQRIEFIEAGNNLIVSPKVVGNVLENATQMFDGIVVQNMLDATYVSILDGSHCHQVRVKELEGYRIVDAAFQRGVLIVTGFKGGMYDKLIVRFDETKAYQSYDVRVQPDISETTVNFTVLDSGVVLHMTDQGELELFSRKQGSGGVKVVSDPAIGPDCLLFSHGVQAMFARGEKLYQFKMAGGQS